MSFFDSEIVQEEVYNNVFKFPTLSKEDQKYHVDVLEKLLDKQKVMYTRLSLSEDPEAQEMKKRIVESASMFGLPQGVDMNLLFNDMTQAVGLMKDQIDKTP